jgi:cytochrome c
MDSFEWNKIFLAVLATALLIMGINIGVDMAMKPHKADKPGIEMAAGDDHGGGGAQPPKEDATPPDWGTLLPAADLAAGDKAHKKCVQCHTFDKGGKDGIGPNLWEIVGAQQARNPTFAYSSGLKGKGGAWTYDELYAFLKKPSAYAPGTKMAFAGIPKREERVNLIAWMRAQADAPQDIPAPNPAAPAPAEGGTPAAPDASVPAAPNGGAPAAGPGDAAPPAPPPADGAAPVTPPPAEPPAAPAQPPSGPDAPKPAGQ